MKYYLHVLKNYVNFDGRARRKEYWMFILFFYIFSIVIGFIGGLIGFELLGTVYILAMILPSIAVSVRRMHDVGKSGWYMLIPIYSFVLSLTEGQPGPNEYGSNPKEEEPSINDHLVS
ncbi:MAG: DUF805 domain-containing protein [Bacteroidota bacterium]|nr:DUF805 domain-containing protein [Bacteroidota bacterium]